MKQIESRKIWARSSSVCWACSRRWLRNSWLMTSPDVNKFWTTFVTATRFKEIPRVNFNFDTKIVWDAFKCRSARCHLQQRFVSAWSELVLPAFVPAVIWPATSRSSCQLSLSRPIPSVEPGLEKWLFSYLVVDACTWICNQFCGFLCLSPCIL